MYGKKARVHPVGWRARDERAHPVVQDAIDKGYLTSGETYWITGLTSHDVANESRLSVGRALEHFGLARAVRVVDELGNPCWKNCADPDAPHGVSFRLSSKDSARAYIAAQSGGDPSKLKYNPYKKKGPGHFNDAGEWISH